MRGPPTSNRSLRTTICIVNGGGSFVASLCAVGGVVLIDDAILASLEHENVEALKPPAIRKDAILKVWAMSDVYDLLVQMAVATNACRRA